VQWRTERINNYAISGTAQNVPTRFSQFDIHVTMHRDYSYNKTNENH